MKKTDLDDYQAAKLLFDRWVGQLTITKSALNRAFRQKAMQNHPDRAAVLRLSPAILQDRFVQIQAAHDLLSQTIARSPQEKIYLVEKRTHTPKIVKPSPFASVRKNKDQRWQHREGDLLDRLYRADKLNIRQVVEARLWKKGRQPKIGSVALDWGLLDQKALQVVVDAQKQLKMRFCDTGVRLGQLSEFERLALLGKQKQIPNPEASYEDYLLKRGLITRHELSSFTVLI